MSHETVNKQFKVDSLSRLEWTCEASVVVHNRARWKYWNDARSVVFVKDKNVRAYEGGLDIDGDE